MRVVYLHQYFRTPEMAGSTRSYEFARRLVESGHEVHMLTCDTDAPTGARTPPWRVTVEDGITVHWAAVPYQNSMPYRRRLRAFGSYALLAAQRARSIEQDVLFASSSPLTIAMPAVYAARRRDVPMVFEVRDLWPETPIALGALRSPISRRAAWRLERWAYHHSDHVIALSPQMADSIRRRFPSVPVTVVPNGSDRGLFADADRAGAALRSATPWLGDRPLILYAGTLGKVNGVRYLVRMAAALAHEHPDIRVAIVGRGAEEAQVRQLADTMGVLDRSLFMLDQVPKSAVVGLFGACDLAVSTVIDEPALHPNSANKVFDAWSAARPVAINHGGWLADIIGRTGCGLVLPATDPRAAAEMVASFIHDPRRTEIAREAAARLARDEFDRDILYDRFENVLLGVTGRTQPIPVAAPN